MSEVLTPRRTLTIRQATMSDIAALMAMAARHWPELPWGHLPMDEEKILRLFVWHMTSDACCVWVIDDGEAPIGCLGLSLMPNIYTGELQAGNAWWYVDPSARGTKASLQLLKTAERWASDHGAALMLGVHTADVVSMLGRMGYRVVETVCRKG